MAFRFLKILAQRSAQTLLLLLLISAVTFGLSALIPGDFFTTHQLDPTIRPETLDLLRQRHGLDQPLVVRYVRWLSSVMRLDLGQSLFYGVPVAGVVWEAGLRTLWIGLPALGIGLLLGIGVGTLHAILRDRWVGRALDGLSAILLSVPTLVLGLLSLLLAARTGWFPVGGSAAPAAGAASWLIDRSHHLILPVLCLTTPIFAAIERIQCAAVESTLLEPHLESARARGLRRGRIFLHHLLRPSLNPVVSVSGPIIGSVLSGSLVLEVIFSWPGLGQVTYEALYNRDPYLLMGCVLCSGMLLVLGNQIADALLRLLDPRAGASISRGRP